jgi:hypothetical protein
MIVLGSRVSRREISHVDVNIVGETPCVEVKAWTIGSDGKKTPTNDVWTFDAECLGEVIDALKAAHDDVLARIVPEHAAASVVDPAEYLDWEGLAGMPLPGDESAP